MNRAIKNALNKKKNLRPFTEDPDLTNEEKCDIALRALGEWHRANRDELILAGATARRRLIAGEDEMLVSIAYARATNRENPGAAIRLFIEEE